MPEKENSNIYYLLNETGNILIQTTLPTHHNLPEFIQKKFSAFSMMSSAMKRAILTTTNPISQKPYSIHNYHAVERILMRSAHFYKESEKTIHVKTHHVSNEFSKAIFYELFEIELGQKDSATITSILQTLSKEALRMIESDHPQEFKAGHIIFLIQYLHGMPILSIRSIYINALENKKNLKSAPCKRRFRHHSSWILHTEEYTYVKE